MKMIHSLGNVWWEQCKTQSSSSNDFVFRNDSFVSNRFSFKWMIFEVRNKSSDEFHQLIETNSPEWNIEAFR